MEQEFKLNSIIRGWAFLLAVLMVCLIWVACQTTPISDFSKIQNNMSKDEVLNIVGSPTRTERFDGKEKWAYRFWTGDDHNVETLRQVTFLNGKVISFGEDTDELNRIKDINADDQKKAEKRKLFKQRALAPETPAQPAPEIKVTEDPPAKPVIEQDFVEQKGRRGPTHAEPQEDN